MLKWGMGGRSHWRQYKRVNGLVNSMIGGAIKRSMRIAAALAVVVCVGLGATAFDGNVTLAQPPDGAADQATVTGPLGSFPDQSATVAETRDGQESAPPAELAVVANGPGIPPLSLLELLLKGRWLMVPIAIMSIAVVMLVIERLFAMRQARVIPSGLLEGLTAIGSVPGVMDPRRAYRLCQQYPSPASVVIRSMLLKIGRPHSEVEHAVVEASEREAERLYGNVRWLSLIAAVAPLTGLLGTVWGMIRAFYDTTHLPLGQNKAEFLAEGIYVALVTTLGGLVVAIPAAIFAHYLEGRVIGLFHQIDELLFSLLPQVERYEGRVRVTPQSLGGVDDELGEDGQKNLRGGSADQRASTLVGGDANGVSPPPPPDEAVDGGRPTGVPQS